MARAEFWDDGRILAIMCPACKWEHPVGLVPGTSPSWTFNGSLDRPTLAPSLLVRWERSDGLKICHSFVRDGRIQFLSDCTHALAGQTVDLPEIVEDEAQ
jgi:hypothetical protein